MEGTIEAVMKGGTVAATVPIAALKPSPTNPRKSFDKGRLAASNAELVKRVADLCGAYDRHPASPAEARQLLGLRLQ